MRSGDAFTKHRHGIKAVEEDEITKEVPVFLGKEPEKGLVLVILGWVFVVFVAFQVIFKPWALLNE